VLTLAGNSNYELGTGDRRPRWRPRVIPEVESTRLLQVACGGYHSAALTGMSSISLSTYSHVEACLVQSIGCVVCYVRGF